MKIIDFSQHPDQQSLIDCIAEGDWSAAKYLARHLRDGSFFRESGGGSLYLLMDGEKIVSFVTLTRRDCIPDDSLYPWLGFFYTFPQYRGHRHGGTLLSYAAEQARKQGYSRVYLATDHIGLYEQYGFSYLESRTDIYGETSRIYVKDLPSMIRPATTNDLNRIAEIEVFNYRLHFYPIFRCDEFYFGDLQVPALVQRYKDSLDHIRVYDDGVVKGFILVREGQVEKLFVEPVLQSSGIGAKLLDHAVSRLGASTLWALEKNTRAIAFYQRHGFHPTGERRLEEDTTEYLVRMEHHSA